MIRALFRSFVLAAVAVAIYPSLVVAQRPQADRTAPVTPPAALGPDWEARFPPLVLPHGFSATLYACDPLVEYPSVIAIGPRQGSLFVAHDYMTGLGVEIVRRDEVRLLEDTDGDGYADRSSLFAGGFNSIQGLAFHDSAVFVMHAPRLTVLRDTDGDSVADQRRDLITGLGLPPEENSNRLHCANGVVAACDGWLYLSLGDRGCDVLRPEGDRLLFQQGGILRCRPDGTDLHIFSTGLRNIYDVAIDQDLNVFVRDNENDGGDYMIRVNHCFFGSDHGYPYHYRERPGQPMPPLADLGRGSSAGGTSYLETVFPQEFRESLFFCEWGRAVVRYRQSPRGSSFQPMTEVDFAAAAATDPYGFKPTDLVVDYDGSLLISDWADGQRPKRSRGRIYRISYQPTADDRQGQVADPDQHAFLHNPPPDRLDVASLIRQLDSASYHRRLAAQLELQDRGASALQAVKAAMQAGDLGSVGRQHRVWLIAGSSSMAAVADLLAVAESDDDPRVCAQAVRAIGDLTDPMLVEGRISAGRGDADVARRIAELAQQNPDPRIVLESLIVMRRLAWRSAPNWIANNLTADEPALNHAATQALRHSRNWHGVADLLDRSPRWRRLALHAMADQHVEFLVAEFIRRIDVAEDPGLRCDYADALSRIIRKQKPWEYWGFRPAPRPAATVDWKQTGTIIASLNARLADEDFEVRSFVLKRMMREGAVPELSKLADWLRDDTDQQRVNGILDALATLDAKTVQPLLIESVLDRALPEASRLKALQGLAEDHRVEAGRQFLSLSGRLENGRLLASALGELGERKEVEADTLLLEKLDSDESPVRAAAIRSLGRRRTTGARNRIPSLLTDSSREVRLAAAEAAGPLGASDGADSLLKLAAGADGPLASASLRSLRLLGDGRAIDAAVAALNRSESQRSAIRYLSEFAGPERMDAVVETAGTNLSIEFQHTLALLFADWLDRYPDSRATVLEAMADVHGQTGEPKVWRVWPMRSRNAAHRFVRRLKDPISVVGTNPQTAEDVIGLDRRIAAKGSQGILLNRDDGSDQAVHWVAWTPIRLPEQTPVEVLTSATGRFTVWLNGHRVYERKTPAAFRADSDRFSLDMRGGMNVIAIEIRGDDQAGRFHLRFRRRSSKARKERLMQFALGSKGNAERGRQVFEDSQQAACLNCHRMGDKGGRIGPDLSGIGRRFSRVHLVESILDPSRSVAPSYSTVAILMNDGRVITGVGISESDDLLILGDQQGKTHEIRKSDIDTVSDQATSIMPEGLEEQLSDRQLADLLAFLESMKSGK